MNELYSKYKAQGFAIVGVTNEPKKLVSETVEKTKREVVIAMVSGDKVDSAYGVNGYPTAFLVDATGHILWTGHGTPDEKMIVEALKDVVPPMPESNKDLNKLLQKRQFGKAYEAIDKVLAKSPDDKEFSKAKSDIDKVLKRHLDQAKAAAEALDFAQAAAIYDEVIAHFTGIPAAAEAKPARDAIDKNPAAKDELAVMKDLKRAEDQMQAGDEDKAVKAWETILKRYPKALAAKRAKDALSQHGR